MKTYYEILEVSELASLETIRATYRSLSKRFHPDNKKTGNEERFKLISEAHECLTDESRRREYDRELQKSRNVKSGVDAEGAAPKKPRAKKKSAHAPEAVPAYDPRQGIEALFEVGHIALRTYGDPVVAQIVTVLRPDLERLVVESLRGVMAR